MISCGDYDVLPQYEHLKVPEERYYRMAEKSKKACLKKFTEAAVVPRGSNRNQVETSTAEVFITKCLSVEITKCGVTKVPYEIMEKVYKSAETILQISNAMVTAPGTTTNQFIVASLSSPANPHTVRIIQENGNIVCDSQCIRWKTYKLCPHILVVADRVPGLLK